MNLQVVKVTKKNGQAWLTCHLGGRYVALLHITDEKLASDVQYPKTLSIDAISSKEVPQAKLIKKSSRPALNSKWDAFDAALGRSDHSKPLPKSRFKDKFTNWSGYPYQHKP